VVDAKKVPSATESARQHWERAQRREAFYSRSLRSIARQVGEFITQLYESGRQDAIAETLRNYADILKPWAQSVSEKMLADIAHKDEQAWMRHAKQMAVAMQQELRTAPMGKVVKELRDRQVDLITSIPLDAAERAQNLAFEAATETSARAKEVAEQIMNSEEVTENKAILIARTEIARSHAVIQEARATWIGSDSYIWHTLKDKQVRLDHQELEGQVFRWDSPPIADKRANRRAHPGCIYSCRCFAEPVLPAKYQSKRHV
jgi:SPP1 gp7 family putative phage head morphogenesis protein